MYSIEKAAADEIALRQLVVEFVRDVRASLDPKYELDFVFEDGTWSWRNRRSNTERSVPSYVFELEPTVARVLVMTSVLEFDFDDVTELWPVCTRHGAHLMMPRVLADKVFWACAQTGESLVEVGQLE